jgi:hypothetical protein
LEIPPSTWVSPLKLKIRCFKVERAFLILWLGIPSKASNLKILASRSRPTVRGVVSSRITQTQAKSKYCRVHAASLHPALASFFRFWRDLVRAAYHRRRDIAAELLDCVRWKSRAKPYSIRTEQACLELPTKFDLLLQAAGCLSLAR